MSKNFYAMFVKGMFGAILFTGSVLSAGESDRIEVGCRAIPHAQKVALYEKIHEEEQQEQEEFSSDPLEGKAKAASPVKYLSTHQGGYHFPVSVSITGETVELEDGSIWQVRYSDKKKTLNWMTSDVIAITQNNAWFSSYDYILANVTTGVKVKVNMALGPYYNGAYTHWVTAIDYKNSRLYLEDGSIWEIGGKWLSYRAVLDTWLASDTIIIGLNGDSSPSTPNLLINVNTNSWVKARCIY